MSRRPSTIILSVLALGVLLLAGCGPASRDLAPVEFRPVVGGDWEVAAPEALGVDSAALGQLYREASRNETTWSVLVVKHGTLVAEAYFHGIPPDSATNLQSATKSVLSALVGLAIQDGCLPGVHVPMMEYFPELVDSIRDPRKLDITLEHLLQMRAGYPWEESNRQLFDLLYEGLRPIHLVEVPLVRPPGEAMEYSNLSSHLVGIILARACETDLLDFADTRLFQPLGIQPGEWWYSWEDYRLGMSSLHLRPRDLAKFGLLYVNHGRWRGEQILDSAWVARSLEIQSTDAWHLSIGRNVLDLAYGYQWWSVRSGNRRYSMAWGHGGQQVALVPDEDMVIVVTADPLLGDHGGGPWKREKQNLNLVGDFVARLGRAPD